MVEDCKLEYMRECLYQQFIVLAEAHKRCSSNELPLITNSMIEVYLLLSGDSFSKVL